MEINFEKATRLDAVIELHKKIFEEDNKSFFESIQSRPYYKTFVASHNEELVAYCIISEIADQAELINIGTRQDFRNQNIASQLLSFAVNNIDAKEVFLEVSTTNTHAIKLYQKCGFVEYGIRKKYYGDTDAILMKLQKT